MVCVAIWLVYVAAALSDEKDTVCRRRRRSMNFTEASLLQKPTCRGKRRIQPRTAHAQP